MITYVKQSLFDAPKGSIIVHACNSMGMWGSGIAKEFAERYPNSYTEYQKFCKKHNISFLTSARGFGKLDDSPEKNHWVGWIVTSHGYGPSKDSIEQIKINTTLALEAFCKDLTERELTTEPINVYSNKFNSGLFKVPWTDTERILYTVVKRYPLINWIVCCEEL